MDTLPPAMIPLVAPFAPLFSDRVWRHALVLVAGTLLAPGKRMATVEAGTALSALRIPAEAFQDFLLDHPRAALSIMKQLVVRLREVEQRIDAWMA